MELAKYATYQEYKTMLDTELRRTAEAFVKIGYLLKVAKDTDILKESGYANVYDFAQAEYGIDKSQVSRFININDRFSEGGYSDCLKEQYQGFGHAKLAIMLQLPDTINEELNPSFSKSEIQTIKDEIDKENEITDLEVLMEGESQEQSCMNSNLCKVLHQLGKDEPELYVKLHQGIKQGVAVNDILAPNGEKTYIIRLQGVGRMMLFLKEKEEAIVLINARSGEKESFPWADAEAYLGKLIQTDMTAETSWTATYGEEFPQKEKVAPVQPKAAVDTGKNEAKKGVKKETRVHKVTPKPKVEEKPEPKKELEEQIPGQDNILNHPEYCPEMSENLNGSSASGTLENVTKDAEIVEKTPLDEPTEAVKELWCNVEKSIVKLNTFITIYTGMYDSVPSEKVNTAYQNALSVAADLERILNHG